MHCMKVPLASLMMYRRYLLNNEALLQVTSKRYESHDVDDHYAVELENTFALLEQEKPQHGSTSGNTDASCLTRFSIRFVAAVGLQDMPR